MKWSNYLLENNARTRMPKSRFMRSISTKAADMSLDIPAETN